MGMILSDCSAAGPVPTGCFASLNAGVVKLGNRRFSRSWHITRSGLVPLSVLFDGRELLSPAPVPETEEAVVPRFRVAGSPLTEVGAPALHAFLELDAPGGVISYHFAVTPGVPAVTVERIAPQQTESVRRTGGDEPTGLETDPAAAAETDEAACCEFFRPGCAHLKLRFFRFADQTDRHDNLLQIEELRLSPAEPLSLRGTLFAVEDPLSGQGIILLKFAPLPERRPLPDGFPPAEKYSLIQSYTSQDPAAYNGYLLAFAKNDELVFRVERLPSRT